MTTIRVLAYGLLDELLGWAAARRGLLPQAPGRVASVPDVPPAVLGGPVRPEEVVACPKCCAPPGRPCVATRGEEIGRVSRNSHKTRVEAWVNSQPAPLPLDEPAGV